MPDSLRRVVDNLYRPLDSGRQVFALSRRDAERLPLLPGVALISVTAPEKEPASLQLFEHILRLCFADVDFNDKRLSSRAKEKLKHAFTKEDAALVLDYVDSLPNHIHSVVVHCEGGYSRSCAIALFLHQAYGYTAQVATLSEHNPSILSTLLTAYKKR